MWLFSKKGKWPDLSTEEIRKRARILVIDDVEFFYLSLFTKDGYTIEKWSDIENLQKLESGYYDIILLDIQGVGRAHSQDEGFGILKHLHQVSPAQIIVAYSNADFSLKFQDFFKMADATLAKTDDYVQFKRTVDHLLASRFSMGFYIDRVMKLASTQVPDPRKLEELTRTALIRRDSGRLAAFLSTQIDDKDMIAMVLQVIEIGLAVAAL